MANADPAPIVADCLVADGIRHGFFTRAGGVSNGIYASLNCGLGSRDDPAVVAANRGRVASWLGTTGERLLTCHQVHSATAVVVTEPWIREAMPRADAIVTATPGIAIGALAADCVPVLFADPDARVVAAAHAGWRGALNGVLEAAVSTMEELGARRAHVRAAVGPCINVASYEVGPEFQARFLATDPASGRFFSIPEGKDRAHFDLPAYVLDRLAAMGLAGVEGRALCTFTNPDALFSYRGSLIRGEPDYGRQISAIVLT